MTSTALATASAANCSTAAQDGMSKNEESSTNQTTAVTWRSALRRAWLQLLALGLLCWFTAMWPPAGYMQMTVRSLLFLLLLTQLAYRLWRIRNARDS